MIPNRQISSLPEQQLRRIQQRLRQAVSFINYYNANYDLLFAVDFTEVYAYLNPAIPQYALTRLTRKANINADVYARQRLALTLLLNNPDRSALILRPHTIELYLYVNKEANKLLEIKGVAERIFKELTGPQQESLRALLDYNFTSKHDYMRLIFTVNKHFETICLSITDNIYLERFGNQWAKLFQLLSENRLCPYGTGPTAEWVSDIHISRENNFQERLYEEITAARIPSAPQAARRDAEALSLIQSINKESYSKRLIFVSRSTVLESVLSRRFPDFQAFCPLESFLFLELWNKGEDLKWYDQLDGELTAAVSSIEALRGDNKPATTRHAKIEESLYAIDRLLSEKINQKLASNADGCFWLRDNVEDIYTADQQTSLTDRDHIVYLLNFAKFVFHDKHFRQLLQLYSEETSRYLHAEVNRLRQLELYQEAYSCFISYSSKDDNFLKQFRNSLDNVGINYWFAPTQLKAGDDFSQEIENAIRRHERLIVVVSRSSLNSEWVRREIEAAFEIESERKEKLIIPLTLDGTLWTTEIAWAANLRRSRYIADFKEWRDQVAYNTVMQGFVRALYPSECQA